MVVEKLEMVETRNRNLEGLLAESDKNGKIREDRIAQLELRVMKLEERAASDFDIVSEPAGDAASCELNDWVTLDKKDHESDRVQLPEAGDGRRKSKESNSRYSFYSVWIVL